MYNKIINAYKYNKSMHHLFEIRADCRKNSLTDPVLSAGEGGPFWDFP
jgi:hypothetical protein